MDPIKVLYVDDEEHNLSSFKATFRNKFDVTTAISAEEAGNILARQEIHVIMSDQRMPGITGAELFERMLKEFPDPIRILITGYADIQAVIKAVNKGKIFHYITKPWNEDEIHSIILCAYASYLMKMENNRMVKGLRTIKEHVDQIILNNKKDEEPNSI